jgi:hypothetical protein
MRNVLVSLMGAAILLVIASGVAFAQTYPAQSPPAQAPPSQQQPAQTSPGQSAAPGQMPSVANLKPFSIEANFMSLPGYLRYLMHQQTGQWLTYAEATRAVRQQKGQ